MEIYDDTKMFRGVSLAELHTHHTLARVPVF